MIRTIVDIEISLEPADDETELALAQYPDLRAKRMELGRILTATVSRAAYFPIKWAEPPPFENMDDPQYLQWLVTYAKYLSAHVSADATGELLELGGLQRDFSNEFAGSTLEIMNVGESCGIKIVLDGGGQCDPCGTKCHKIGGVVHTSCPGGSSYTTLHWSSTWSGLPIVMFPYVTYRFYYFDSDEPQSAMSADSRSLDKSLPADAACVARADKLFTSVGGNAPPFWSYYKIDLAALRKLFDFFCQLRDVPSEQMRTELRARLIARANKRAPLPLSANLADEFNRLASIQINLIRSLAGLDCAAFDCFASGSLGTQILSDGQNELAPSDFRYFAPSSRFPVPDGAAFFYWPDFALLAAATDQRWIRVLQCLLRAQHIYMQAYGPRDSTGTPEKCPRLESYKIGNYRRVVPDEFANVDYSRIGQLPALEAEFVKIIQKAFPCGL